MLRSWAVTDFAADARFSRLDAIVGRYRDWPSGVALETFDNFAAVAVGGERDSKRLRRGSGFGQLMARRQTEDSQTSVEAQ